MESLQQSFNDLRHLLKTGRGLSHSGDDPVYYLVFGQDRMLELKRQIKSWAVKLKHDGWQVEVFSMADAVDTILGNHPLRDIWLTSEKDAPLEFDEVNRTLADALTADDTLKDALKYKLETLKGRSQTVLFVTDLEALHPYLRVGALEQKLTGKFFVPTVIFYPGVRAGKTTLRFLGIYPEDGNYRSVHLGG